MTERRLRRHLLLAALLLVAQTLVVWHGPSHILDGHGHGPVAQQDCQALHGHGLACSPVADLPPARFTPPLTVPYPVGAPDLPRPRVHPARAPPVFS
ncbi:MAG: hypothetical protein ABGX87_11985 [Alcanivorax sp.]|uniref:Uncharacterized protein n=1 Tax=Alloalcanivorax marinus TaxID=1177169 RepID=A0A9Q3YMN2_9GAMM|nr:hypothetical protein [Alloalcanivorax marinus]MBM7334628.1 hypothetical protein [Alloalcanivorax marinus]MCC4307020.1 hypothetical protein [Alloalcanivorax marinus]MCU5788508.1 hypothetical protein [Alloalcanivorax marinus]